MNKNIWNLYKNSERGENAIALFTISDEDLKSSDIWTTKFQEIFRFCKDFVGETRNENWFIEYLFDTNGSMLIDGLLMRENEDSTEYFERLIDNLDICYIDFTEDGQPFKSKKYHSWSKEKRDYIIIHYYILEISFTLYVKYPERFFPMFFTERFDILIKIFDILEITLPTLPANVDKRGRALLYKTLNDNIMQFRDENNLTSQELCACIYDFALMLVEEDENTDTDLPEPTNIWLTMDSKIDCETCFNKSSWCNFNTKRGDIVVMYYRRPDSCIQSIWRACSDSVYTPFDLNNSIAKISNMVAFPPVTYKELKEDGYFSKRPFVSANFSRFGVPFSATDYKELQRLLTAKGLDVSVLPQLYKPDLEVVGTLKNEKDVEEKLLIPILEKLGYAETDWTRQLLQKAGRNEKAIPDFVFFPTGEIHFQNAPMIIEAKYDMSSNLERTKTYNQALSYARMMKSSIFGICDKDRLIIYKEKNGNFDRFKPIFEKHWQSLNEAETFSKLKNVIGKNVIKK